MERPVSAFPQRTTPFNPKAAVFNPKLSSPISNIVDTVEPVLPTPTPPETTSTAIRMAPMFNYPPFHGAGSIHSYYQDSLSPARVRLQDLLKPDRRHPTQTFKEYPDAQEVQTSHTPLQETSQDNQVVARSTTNLPRYTILKRPHRTDSNAVDIDELSAGLGLPAQMVDTGLDASTTASTKSRVSHTHSGALYGKLIGWALDKPLTGKGLAEYLQNPGLHTSLEAPAPALQLSRSTALHQVMEEEVHPMSARLPPNLNPTDQLPATQAAQRVPKASQRVRKAAQRDRKAAQRVPIPARAESFIVPQGPSAAQHQRRRSSVQSAGSIRHHTRIPSNSNYPRRTSRAKRMDQGPIPSAADIYPEDATWTPPVPTQGGFDYVSHNQRISKGAERIVDDTLYWPTPAELYEHKAPPMPIDPPAWAGRAKRMFQGPIPSAADIYPEDATWTPAVPTQGGFDYVSHNQRISKGAERIVDDTLYWPTPAEVYTHKPPPTPIDPPTGADVDAADHEVLALIDRDLNEPAGLDLPCDTRALTPAQLDGSRYGIRFHGIAHDDQWEPLKVADGELWTEPFRVRPREHDGWGGWEWAMRKGWATASETSPWRTF